MKKYKESYEEWLETLEILKDIPKAEKDSKSQAVYYFMSISKFNMNEFKIALESVEEALQIYEGSDNKNPGFYEVLINHLNLVNAVKAQYDNYNLNKPKFKRNSLLSLLYPDSTLKWSLYVSGAIVIGGGIFMYLKRNQ